MAPAATVLSVVGTRPNFMKIAPVAAALAADHRPWRHVLVHTGQHYDDAMSRVFLRELGIGEPDHRLDVGSGSHAHQTALVIQRLEPVLRDVAPDIVLVPGDVNSTLAAALTAVQMHLPVAHVEAGLRSFDRTMPEELNRVLVDAVSDLLFTHSPEAREHLLREGADPAAIHAVGNTMIDTLVTMQPRLDPAGAAAAHGVRPGEYVVVTLHRPALVDGALLADALDALERLAAEIPVVFPAHPRTRAALQARGLGATGAGLRVVAPLGYVEFLGLVAGAAGVVTDSGGIQEETTFLGVPCFTLRSTTERPVTVTQGTNVMLGQDPGRIAEVPGLLARAERVARVPEGWDGHAAERIVDVLAGFIAAPARG